MKRITTETATYGQIVELLTNLGFTRSRLDANYDVFADARTDMSFPLPICPPQTLARGPHVDGLRLQLDYRGILNTAAFDAYFARPTAVKSS